MSIEEHAEHDLSLDAQAAENVAGGKKSTHNTLKSQTAITSSIVTSAPPEGLDMGPDPSGGLAGEQC